MKSITNNTTKEIIGTVTIFTCFLVMCMAAFVVTGGITGCSSPNGPEAQPLLSYGGALEQALIQNAEGPQRNTVCFWYRDTFRQEAAHACVDVNITSGRASSGAGAAAMRSGNSWDAFWNCDPEDVQCWSYTDGSGNVTFRCTGCALFGDE